jgi:2-hydroxychromene-2-carboxylate isomerase
VTAHVDATLFYDLGSPYAYLTAERIDSLIPDARWTPISLGALFKGNGRSSWGLGPERKEGQAECERRAIAYGLPPIVWPDPWPGHMLLAMRAATLADQRGGQREFALAAFRRAFVQGEDLSDPEVVRAAAIDAGFAADLVERAADKAVKDALRAATEEAAARGVQGVPSVVAGGEIYWGDDRLEAAAASVS